MSQTGRKEDEGTGEQWGREGYVEEENERERERERERVHLECKYSAPLMASTHFKCP